MSGYLLDCEAEHPDYIWLTPDEIAADYSLPTAFRPWQKKLN